MSGMRTHRSESRLLGRRHTLACGAAVILALLASAACGTGTEAKSELSTVEWFVGLGTGSSAGQIEIERALVARFNRQHDDVKMKLTVVDSGTGPAAFQKRIDAGDLPDIIGPLGIGPSGEWSQLFEPVDESAVDLSKYPDDQLLPYRSADGALMGVPIGVYPSALFYNKDLFARADLPFPPHEAGQPYRGRTWDWDNLRDTAKLLTVDAAGKHSGESGFNPDTRVQWGFHDEYVDEPRPMGALFGPGSLIAADGSVQIPPAWQTQWQWYHDMIWTDFSVPTSAQANSEVLANGSPFMSGNVAMVTTHSWFAPSLEGLPSSERIHWDVAIMPSYTGTITSRSHADSYRILKTDTPAAASSAALSFLANEAAADLVEAFGPVPSRVDLRDAFVARQHSLDQAVDWKVFVDSVKYADHPNHEVALPNHSVSIVRLEAFYKGLVDDADFDVANESNALARDLGQLISAEPSTTPSSGG